MLGSVSVTAPDGPLLESYVQSRLVFLDAYIRALSVRHQLFNIVMSSHTSADVEAEVARLLGVPVDVGRSVLNLPLSHFSTAPRQELEEEVRRLRRMAL